MAIELKDILYFLMGIIAVCLVISFSAYQLTTYDAVRDDIGGISAQSSQVVNLHTQYDSMVDQFNNGQGDTFTYHWGHQDIDVTRAQAGGPSYAQAIGYLLDQYAKNIYSGNVNSDLTTAHNVAGSGANGLYFIAAILSFAIIFIILVLSFIQQWYGTTKELLKSAGKVLLIVSVIAFIFFLVAPPIIQSVMWDNISSSNWSLEVSNVIIPRITGTFLVNTLILVLFGALLYGAGFLMHVNGSGEEVDVGDYVRSKNSQKAEQKGMPRVQSDPRNGTGKPPRKQL